MGAKQFGARVARVEDPSLLTRRHMQGPLATEPIPTPVPNPAITAMRTQRALACDEVCNVGEAIALVVADNRYVAEDAADAIVVDFERLNAVSDCGAGLDDS